jgi:hypothetical protein
MMVKRLISYVKDNPKRVRQFILWAAILVITAVVAVVGAYYFDLYTESDKFCGLVCHANRPQYVTSEVSPHAEVECGICHIGPGLTPKLSSKIYGVGELYKQLTNTYERPIPPPVARLRSARDICEQCHWSEKLHPNWAYLSNHFATDEENSLTRVFFVLRLGQGGPLGASAEGIHWHIENLSYAALDPQQQEIPWIGIHRNGRLEEYVATDSSLTAEELEQLPRRQMDCLDCHNRAAHIFRRPERSLDEALATERIDHSLPFVKREALKLLSASYSTQEAGVKAMEGLEEFYRSQYPALYADKQQVVQEAIAVLQDIYSHTVFPDMNLNWESYPDNSGHLDFPGCFRCHDGNHVNEQGEPIPSNCTLCHSVPVVVGAGQDVALRGMVLPQEKPDSHRAADFGWDHRILADDTCAECHGSVEYGTDNTSFCANGICHDGEWPEPAAVAEFVHPVRITGQHAQLSCNECHQGVREPSYGDCATCHEPPSDPHLGATCSQCHNPYGWEDSAAAWLAVVSTIPHRVAVAMDCLSCHTDGTATSIPADHQEFPGELCVECHDLEPAADRLAIPHIVEGRGRCRVCHDEGKLAPPPSGHVGWPNETCLLCHEAANAG